MKQKTILMILSGAFISLVFMIISLLIKDTELIWIQTRLFGLLSFVFLFITVIIGELRVLSIKKARFKIFKYHMPIAVFAMFLVFLHLISAIADNYKWGEYLTFTQYLGFSFSDKWLVFLSFGALAFYLMILMGVTSCTKSIQLLKYKNWKMIHYLSYVSFLMAYLHSINLGTDLKISIVASFLKPIFLFMFLVVIALLMTRILYGLKLFGDQKEINLAAIFFILLLLTAVYHISTIYEIQDGLEGLKNKVKESRSIVSIYEEDIQRTESVNDKIKSDIDMMKQNTKMLENQINEV